MARAQRPGAGPAPAPRPRPLRPPLSGLLVTAGLFVTAGLLSRPRRGQVSLKRYVSPVTGDAASRKESFPPTPSGRGWGGGEFASGGGQCPSEMESCVGDNGGTYGVGGFLRGLVPCDDGSDSEYTYIFQFSKLVIFLACMCV